MAWIESHQSLMSHHKTRKAARLLGVRPVHLIGHLHALWWWALDYADDGDVTRFDVEDIADAAQWEDDAAGFVEALTACGPGDAPGFLERTDDGRLLIHDWWDYAGKLVERRRADAERKRSSRHPETVQRTSSGHPADGAKSPSVTVTNSNPNQPTNQTEDLRPPVAAAPRKTTPAPKPAKNPRPRNVTWDALASLCGSPATDDEESDFGKTVSQLDAINATPEEIEAFGPWWYENHEDARLTHRCLRRHFGAFRNAPIRPPTINDLKNPAMRSIATVNLSDIEADLEAKHGTRNRLQAENGRSDFLPSAPRRFGTGGGPPEPDVLPQSRRAQHG